jgi:hypothetical protein
MNDATQPQREVLIALSNPVSGKDEEFRTWYWETHIPEVLALPAFVSAECYRLQNGEVAPYQYTTIYQVEGSAVDARNLLFSGVVGMSDLLDLSVMMTAPFSPPFTQLAR